MSRRFLTTTGFSVEGCSWGRRTKRMQFGFAQLMPLATSKASSTSGPPGLIRQADCRNLVLTMMVTIINANRTSSWPHRSVQDQNGKPRPNNAQATHSSSDPALALLLEARGEFTPQPTSVWNSKSLAWASASDDSITYLWNLALKSSTACTACWPCAWRRAKYCRSSAP